MNMVMSSRPLVHTLEKRVGWKPLLMSAAQPFGIPLLLSVYVVLHYPYLQETT